MGLDNRTREYQNSGSLAFARFLPPQITVPIGRDRNRFVTSNAPILSGCSGLSDRLGRVLNEILTTLSPFLIMQGIQEAAFWDRDIRACLGARLRTDTMETLIVGGIALLLFIYLLIAVVRPEKF